MITRSLPGPLSAPAAQYLTGAAASLLRLSEGKVPASFVRLARVERELATKLDAICQALRVGAGREGGCHSTARRVSGACQLFVIIVFASQDVL